MVDTLTPNYHWVKPEAGSSPTTWGVKVNSDLDLIDGQVQTNANTAASASSAATAAAAAATTAAAAAQTTANAALPKTGGTMTGALAPSQTAGLTGTTTNNNANAGAVGEYLTAANNTDTPVANGAAMNIISISLTAGDWDVDGTGSLGFSTSGTDVFCALSLVPATQPPALLSGSAEMAASQIFFAQLATGPLRVSIAASTIVYLVLGADFSTGTCVGQGMIRARRVR